MGQLKTKYSPEATVDGTVTFRLVSFNETVSKPLTVSNSGKVAFKFHVKNSKPSLAVNPPMGFLKPGQKKARHARSISGPRDFLEFKRRNRQT